MIGAFIRIVLVLLAVSTLAFILVLFGTTPERRLFKTGPLDTLETSLVIRDANTRQSIFGRLESRRDVDYFTIPATSPTDMTISIRTFATDPDFNPVMTLYGPGLAKPMEDTGIPIGDQNGAVVGRIGQKTRTSHFDMGLLTSFNNGPVLQIRLPRVGTYALAVAAPNGATGRYVLSMGTASKKDMDTWASYLTGTLQAILRVY